MNGGTKKNKTKQNKNIQTQNNNRKERTNDKNINYTCTVSALNSKKKLPKKTTASSTSTYGLLKVSRRFV